MKWMFMTIAALLLALPAAPVAAQSAPEPEVLVRKPVKHHPRPRIEVRPRYPYRTYHSLYPVPYAVEYPGPNAHRECTGGYRLERRPSGDVVTPWTSCRWVRGRYAGP